jgi:hypothetical protein
VKGHEYFYEQNVSTAAAAEPGRHRGDEQPAEPGHQRRLLLRPVAPQFSYNAAKNNRYWPETLFASNQGLDVDSAGQSYMGELACPPPNRNACSFDGALGLGQAEKARAPGAGRHQGLQGLVQVGAAAAAADPGDLLAELQHVRQPAPGRRPNLTPPNMMAGAPRLGSRGGGTTGFSRRAFEKGELSWTQDVFVTWWQKNKKSPYNSETGAFTQAYGGKRFGLGQIPKGDPAVPTVDKRA